MGVNNPNILRLLRLNDRKSRHRGSKKQRRYERLAATSQLSCGNFSVTSNLNLSGLEDR